MFQQFWSKLCIYSFMDYIAYLSYRHKVKYAIVFKFKICECIGYLFTDCYNYNCRCTIQVHVEEQ